MWISDNCNCLYFGSQYAIHFGLLFLLFWSKRGKKQFIICLDFRHIIIVVNVGTLFTYTTQNMVNPKIVPIVSLNLRSWSWFELCTTVSLKPSTLFSNNVNRVFQLFFKIRFSLKCHKYYNRSEVMETIRIYEPLIFRGQNKNIDNFDGDEV